jgi:hypothetical protein
MSLGGILPKGNNDHAHSLPTALCPQTLSDRIEGMKERSHAMLAAEWVTSKNPPDNVPVHCTLDPREARAMLPVPPRVRIESA